MSFEQKLQGEETPQQKITRKKEKLISLEATVKNIENKIETTDDKEKIGFLKEQIKTLETDIEDLRKQISEDEERDDVSGLTF